MPSAIVKHQQLVARIKAQQAKVRAKQIAERSAARANAPRPAPPKSKAVPVKAPPKTKLHAKQERKAARKNPGAHKPTASPAMKPRGTKSTGGGTMPGRNGGGYRYTGTGEVIDAMGRVVVDVATAAGEEYVRGKMGASSTSTDGVSAKEYEPAYYYRGRGRRRRRRLLTASDKADIAFIIGQLGTGQVGRAAISALLSRRV